MAGTLAPTRWAPRAGSLRTAAWRRGRVWGADWVLTTTPDPSVRGTARGLSVEEYAREAIRMYVGLSRAWRGVDRGADL